MSLPDLGPEIERMTAYCTYCPKMCRFSCPTAGAESRETVTPWGMMRLLEMAKDGSVTLDSDIADAFYHCTGCRRCQSFCEHDNDVPRALWKARRWAVDSGFLPDAYQQLYDRFKTSHTPYGEPEIAIDTAVFDEQATVAFWPDCSTVSERPKLVAAVGRLLKRVVGHPVRLVMSEDFDHPPCCGFPLTGAGIENPETCRDNWWPTLDGIETIWTDCSALAAMHTSDSSWAVDARPDDPDIGHIYRLLADELPAIEPDELIDAADALLHESCYVTRQLDGLDDVAIIIAHIADRPPEKMAYSGDESPCCGGRCHYRLLEPEASREAARKVVESVDRNDHTDRMVTTSSMCQKAMVESADEVPVASLLEMVCRAYDCDK